MRSPDQGSFQLKCRRAGRLRVPDFTKMTNTQNHRGDLTKRQTEDVERFLHLFSDIESQLKTKLSLSRDDRTAASDLIKRYRDLNPFWTASADELLFLGAIRNFLTHHRSTAHGYPVAVTPGSVGALDAIKTHLIEPTTISSGYRKKVDTVYEDAPLASVVAVAFEKGYSQFPVVTAGKFRGLITESGITRWLGRRAKANGTNIDLTAVTVKTILREKDPYLKDIPIFRFASLDAPVEEVMGLFAARPALEVVLLTRTGDKASQIEGIVTQWDAARYPA